MTSPYAANSQLVFKFDTNPRITPIRKDITSAGGTHYFWVDPDKDISFMLLRGGEAMSLESTNDIPEDGDLSNAEWFELEDDTTTVDYYKGDNRGVLAMRIVKAATTTAVVAKVRMLALKQNK